MPTSSESNTRHNNIRPASTPSDGSLQDRPVTTPVPPIIPVSWDHVHYFRSRNRSSAHSLFSLAEMHLPSEFRSAQLECAAPPTPSIPHHAQAHPGRETSQTVEDVDERPETFSQELHVHHSYPQAPTPPAYGFYPPENSNTMEAMCRDAEALGRRPIDHLVKVMRESANPEKQRTLLREAILRDNATYTKGA